MANFLTFEENKVLINDKIFPANGISLQLNANTVPVKDIYGNVLYYSPNGPIQGSVGLSFFLTGALPSYFRLENQDESPIKVAFNTILIPDCYLTNLSFSVRPFEPIPVKADLVFYHGIKALNTDPIVVNAFATNLLPKNIANSSEVFTSNLKTLNGTASYILTENRSSWIENPTDFVVTDFDYQFSVERTPILRVGDKFPTRVAMKEANAEFSLTTNNIDGYLDIHGNSAEFSAILRDSASLSTYDTINLTGIIVDQSYDISEDNYGSSKIKMTQALNRKRSSITIPMEVSDPNIVSPPTNNIVNPPNTPTTTEIKEEVKKEEPKPNDPEKGTTTTPTPEIDTTVWYYVNVVVSVKMINANNANCNAVDLFSLNLPSGFDEYINGSQKFSIISNRFTLNYKSSDKEYFDETKNQYNYNAKGTVMTFKATADFINAFSTNSIGNNTEFMYYRGIPCKPTNVANNQWTATYERFFINTGGAINDIHKNKNTPYELDLTSYNNQLYELGFIY